MPITSQLTKMSFASRAVLKKSQSLWVLSSRCVGNKAAAKPSASSGQVKDVPGLSSAVLATPTGAVGPGASKSGEYKNPEYFSYNRMSYHEAEIEMKSYRNPQPSAKLPLVPS